MAQNKIPPVKIGGLIEAPALAGGDALAMLIPPVKIGGLIEASFATRNIN